MALNYTGTTIGTLTLCQPVKERNEKGEYVEVKDKNGKTKYEKIPIQIRDGNCMAIFIHVHKIVNLEDPKKCWMHDLVMFFIDEQHMKRCLNNKENGKQTFEDLFWGKLTDIKLNIYYKNMLTLAKYMVRDGLKVQIYYEDPKNKK